MKVIDMKHALHEMQCKDWSDPTRCACPVCDQDIDPFSFKADSNAHLSSVSIDDLTKKVSLVGDEWSDTDSESPFRGTSVSFKVWFEQCEHIITHRFHFHKGDVFFSWRLSGSRDDQSGEYPPECPRT